MLVSAQVKVIEALTARLDAVEAENAELKRQVAADSSNSSRPPSSDAPWAKKPAKKRSSRTRSGRKPGKQPGASGSSRGLVDDPDDRLFIQLGRCRRCDASLAAAAEHSRQRRQVVDVCPPPPPTVTEYQRISKVCGCCGTVTTPGWDDPAVSAGHAETVAAPGSPVRLGPETLARAVLLSCAHYLPVGRSRDLLEALCGIDVSTGFLAGIRGRAARRLEKKFLGHMRKTLVSAPVLHADETPGRAAGSLSCVHVACTEYLALMHVGDRSAATVDAGGVLAEFTGVLVRDGYAGCEHLRAVHAWCGAHLLRDLQSISDATPDGQLWAHAMATTLAEANQAAIAARERGEQALDPLTLKRIRNHYLGALACGEATNRDAASPLADKARILITRFRRFEDMILRFTTDLTVPFTNNEARKSVQTRQGTTTYLWRLLTHPARPHRLRRRPVLPGHSNQMGPQQTPGPPRTLHHWSLAAARPHTR